VDENRVEVTGTATADARPDRVGWWLVVNETGGDALMVFDRCAARAAGVAEAVDRELGDQAYVTMQGVRVSPRVEDGRERGPEATSFIGVETPVEHAGEAARVAMDAGADRVDGPAFRVSDAAARREALVGEAVEAARRKAEHAAEAAGRSLGRVVSIAEGAEQWGPPGDMRRAGSGAARRVRVDAQDQQLFASVRVKFELEP
jgi:uncharacterized protein